MYDQSSIYPSSVVYRFPGKRCDGSASDSVPSYYIKTITLDSLGISHAGSPRPKVFHSSALALYNVSGGPPTNQAALDALAAAHARDYCKWLGVQFDRVSPCVVSVDMSPIYDEVITLYDPSGVSTRVTTERALNDPEQLMHHDPANSACSATVTPCVGAVTGIACSGSVLRYTMSKICLVDGRLTQEYVGTFSV